MSNVLALAMRVTADASQLGSSLTPVERALKKLGDEADKSAALFKKFATDSAAAAQAQGDVRDRFDALAESLKSGAISADEYASEFAKVQAAAKETAAAFAEGLQITERNRTAEEQRSNQLERLRKLLALGAIDAQTFGREVAGLQFDGSATARFGDAVAGLTAQLQAGQISYAQFASASSEIASAVDSATPAAQRQEEAILALRAEYDAGRISLEKYNEELSKIESGDIRSTFQVEVLGVREGIESTEQLQQSLGRLTSTQVEAAVEVSGAGSLDELRRQFADIDGTEIDALLSVLGVDSIEAARAQLDLLNGTTASTSVDVANVEQSRSRLSELEAAFGSLESAMKSLDSAPEAELKATLELLGVDDIDAARERLNALGALQIQPQIEALGFESIQQAQQAFADLESLSNTEISALIEILGAENIDDARDRLNALSAIDVTPGLELLGVDSIEAARDQLNNIQRTELLAELRTAGFEDIERARDLLATLDDKNVTAIAETLGIESVQELFSVIEAVESKTVTVEANANTDDAAAKVKSLREEFAAANRVAETTTLKFNELSGVFSILPGPLGSIAGRLSGISSASEGLSRIFAGGLSQGVSGLAASFTSLINPVTAAVAGLTAFAVAAQQVALGLVQLEDRVEKLGNVASKLGVSFKFVQTIEEAAKRSGTSIDAVSAAFGRLQNSILGVDEESKKSRAALAAIGVEADALKSLSPEEQYKLIGERLAQIEDPAQRTAAATALFGKAGADLIPFFNNLPGAATDIERLGGALSDLDKARIDDFGTALDALSRASSRLGEVLLVPFAGLGEGIDRGASEFVAGITAIVKPIGDVLEPAFTNIGRLFDLFFSGLGAIGRTIGAVLEPIGTVFQAISQALEPLNDGIVDFFKGFQDGAVAVTEFIVSFSPIGVIADNIGAISETISRISVIVTTAFGKVRDAVLGVVEQFGSFIGQSPLISAIGEAITSVFGSVSETFAAIASAIGGTVGRLLTIAENILGIRRDTEEPIALEVDISQPSRAATQFANEIDTASRKAAEFGQAGFEAALKYQQALEEVAALQGEGEFSADQAKRAADLAKQAFEQTIEVLGREADAQAKAAEAAQKAADDRVAAAQRVLEAQDRLDASRADAFIRDQQIGVEDAQTRTAEDLLAILRQIDAVETAIVEARASGDEAAEASALRRLQILDQAQAAAQEAVDFGFTTQDAERTIEGFRSKLDGVFTFDNFEIAPDAFKEFQSSIEELEQQLRDKAIDPGTYREAVDTLVAGFQEAVKEAERLGELQLKYAERVAEIDAERVEALSRASREPLKVEDVRTSGGISEFLRLATGREDPAIDEARKQTRELEKLRTEIVRLGGQVEIVGAG